jgi:hypothetical protein
MKDVPRSLLAPVLAASLLAGAMAGLNGCRTPEAQRTLNGLSDISFSLQPSTRNVIAGEIVTLTANASNTVGRDATVTWRTSGGQLTTDANGRIARVQFDSAGLYTVSAVLNVDDQLVLADAVDINVRPLR